MGFISKLSWLRTERNKFSTPEGPFGIGKGKTDSGLRYGKLVFVYLVYCYMCNYHLNLQNMLYSNM